MLKESFEHLSLDLNVIYVFKSHYLNFNLSCIELNSSLLYFIYVIDYKCVEINVDR